MKEKMKKERKTNQQQERQAITRKKDKQINSKKEKMKKERKQVNCQKEKMKKERKTNKSIVRKRGQSHWEFLSSTYSLLPSWQLVEMIAQYCFFGLNIFR